MLRLQLVFLEEEEEGTCATSRASGTCTRKHFCLPEASRSHASMCVDMDKSRKRALIFLPAGQEGERLTCQIALWTCGTQRHHPVQCKGTHPAWRGRLSAASMLVCCWACKISAFKQRYCFALLFCIFLAFSEAANLSLDITSQIQVLWFCINCICRIQLCRVCLPFLDACSKSSVPVSLSSVTPFLPLSVRSVPL